MSEIEPQNASTSNKKSVWISTPTPNLVKYVPKGSYYLRARVRGQVVRESLDTCKYPVATFRLRERLRALRSAADVLYDGPETLWQALQMVRSKVQVDPSLKDSTRQSYFEEIDCMAPGWSASVPCTPLSKLSAAEMRDWWSRAAAGYAAQRANHLLMFVRRALKLARKYGVMHHDPTEELRRVKIARTRLNLPTADEFRAVVQAIRDQRKAHSEQAANWVEFMAYSGMRPAEIDAVRWADVHEHHIMAYGGRQGTKNRLARSVPIIPPMRDLLARMERTNGAVFSIGKPRDALRNACRRVGIERQRIYNLRHLFATQCRNAGVPVPTFAEWLGHQDGGALAMRTYVQCVEEHAKTAAAKVTFL